MSGIEIDCSGLGGIGTGVTNGAARECKAQGYKVITSSSDAKDEGVGIFLAGIQLGLSLAPCW